ncbi:MAG: nicotinate-nucleotide adenylyltransferase [Gammaproteobacteria bacterium]
MKPIGLLGGTFDPVHFGHLRLAAEVIQRLDLEELRFVPLHVPPHREAPRATAEQRYTMLQMAITDVDCLRVDNRELHREGVSYTIDTVKSLRKETGNTPLCLLLGMDAFKSIDTWHRWEELLTYVHIIIADRPGTTLPTGVKTIKELVDEYSVDDYTLLHQAQAGKILYIPVPMLDISSTHIRQQISNQNNVRFLLPDAVLDYIHTNHLYQDCS